MFILCKAMKEISESDIILAIIKAGATIENDIVDDDDEDYVPDNSDESETSPKIIKKVVKKRKPLNIRLTKPKPVNNLEELIDALKEAKIYKKAMEDAKNTKNPTKKRKRENYENFQDIINLVEALEELQNMTGMKEVKEKIVHQLLLFIQKLNDPGMFLHTVLTGLPGTGKTSLCHILARIYKSMGFLEKSSVIVADRSQLVGQWLGETSIKTKKVLESAKGGVLLIDEAYSLGSNDNRDSFAKECVDTINQFLSEHCDELVCIIAGYRDEIDKCFFAQNQGLSRRFAWRYHLENYKPPDLCEIFRLQAEKVNWEIKCSDEFLENLFKKHKNVFKNNGGDTLNLLDRCKITHAKRIFGTRKRKRILTEEDICSGFEMFEKLNKKHNSATSEPPIGLYC